MTRGTLVEFVRLPELVSTDTPPKKGEPVTTSTPSRGDLIRWFQEHGITKLDKAGRYADKALKDLAGEQEPKELLVHVLCEPCQVGQEFTVTLTFGDFQGFVMEAIEDTALALFEHECEGGL
jgi:hypothetical protein